MSARLLSGLIQTGAWTCLDEFNRINIEVLSVIAEQVRLNSYPITGLCCNRKKDDTRVPHVAETLVPNNAHGAKRTVVPSSGNAVSIAKNMCGRQCLVFRLTVDGTSERALGGSDRRGF